MQHKILIVEDNPAIRENTIELLELSGYTVLSACDGQEGLDTALKQSPNLILCDIKMPAMDGYHLLERIRKDPVLADTKFIFFTASAEKKDIELGMHMGANGYITKPFSCDDLLGRIKTLLSDTAAVCSCLI